MCTSCALEADVCETHKFSRVIKKQICASVMFELMWPNFLVHFTMVQKKSGNDWVTFILRKQPSVVKQI